MGNKFRHSLDDDMVFTFSEIKTKSKEYKGWDWAEVYEALGIDPMSPEVSGEYSIDKYTATQQITYKRLQDELDICFKELPPYGDGLSARSRDVLLACRAYVYAAGSLKISRTYLKPVWHGLSQVRSDEEFIKLYRLVFPFIWD